MSFSQSGASWISNEVAPAQPVTAGQHDRQEQSSIQASAESVQQASTQRVSIACRHCRRRKVRCDGAFPSCRLCDRLGKPCVYASVTLEENSVLREKKRQCKVRKAERAEEADVALKKHGAFPAYSPHANNTWREPSRAIERPSAATTLLKPSPVLGNAFSPLAMNAQPWLTYDDYATSLLSVGSQLPSLYVPPLYDNSIDYTTSPSTTSSSWSTSSASNSSMGPGLDTQTRDLLTDPLLCQPYLFPTHPPPPASSCGHILGNHANLSNERVYLPQ